MDKKNPQFSRRDFVKATAGASLLGMLPAAVARGIGSDIQRPMATVIVGGLVSTLVLTLLAMPSLYYLTSRRRAPAWPR